MVKCADVNETFSFALLRHHNSPAWQLWHLIIPWTRERNTAFFGSHFNVRPLHLTHTSGQVLITLFDSKMIFMSLSFGQWSRSNPARERYSAFHDTMSLWRGHANGEIFQNNTSTPSHVTYHRFTLNTITAVFVTSLLLYASSTVTYPTRL